MRGSGESNAPPISSELHFGIEGIEPCSGRKLFGSIRFGSRLFEHIFGSVRFGLVRFGSVRKHIFPGSTWFGLRFSDRPWLGPVQFGSVPRPVPAGSGIKRLGSVRFGWFDSAGSVRFLIPSCHWCRQVRAEEPVACTVSKQYARKRASRTHTDSASPSCAIIHAQAHAPVPHSCVFYPCDNDNNDNNRKDTTRIDSFRFQTFRKLIGSVRFGRFGSVSQSFLNNSNSNDNSSNTYDNGNSYDDYNDDNNNNNDVYYCYYHYYDY